MKRAAEPLWGTALCLVSLLVLTTAFSADFFVSTADEFTVAWIAKLANEGYAPYRDYFAFLPPGAIYFFAGVFRLFGTSIGAMRLAMIVMLMASTCMLYCLFLRTRIGAGWAAVSALVLPAIFVPFWPVPSHHWLALAPGIGSLLCMARENVETRDVFAAALLACIAGLVVQTAGVVFGVLILLRVLTFAGAGRGRLFGAAVLGGALPAAITIVWLGQMDLLSDAYRHIIVWPLKYYKQPGGFNDTSVGGVADLFAPSEKPGVLATATMAWIATIPLVFIGAVAASFRRPKRRIRSRWCFALLGYVVISIVYFLGRVDWTHFAFLAAPLVYLLFQQVDWSAESTRPRLLRGWIAITLVLMLRWPGVWLHQPPSIAGVAGIDDAMRERGLPAVLRQLPVAVQNEWPVLFLSHAGAGLYFYWSPGAPPPVDWMQPPAFRANSPAEFERLAHHASAHAVPYVIVPDWSLESWLEDPSPVRELLRQQYRPAFETDWGTVFCRIDVVAPQPACPHGDSVSIGSVSARVSAFRNRPSGRRSGWRVRT